MHLHTPRSALALTQAGRLAGHASCPVQSSWNPSVGDAFLVPVGLVYLCLNMALQENAGFVPEHLGTSGVVLTNSWKHAVRSLLGTTPFQSETGCG